jgi:hypothetical protein
LERVVVEEDTLTLCAKSKRWMSERREREREREKEGDRERRRGTERETIYLFPDAY